MKQEDRELLLKDLCARLPYRPKVLLGGKEHCILCGIDGDDVYLNVDSDSFSIKSIKPLLRPMSSMTEDEMAEFKWLNGECDKMPTFEYVPVENYRIYDWMNRHHLDYRGLIEKGLALPASEGMYNIKEK